MSTDIEDMFKAFPRILFTGKPVMTSLEAAVEYMLHDPYFVFWEAQG